MPVNISLRSWTRALIWAMEKHIRYYRLLLKAVPLIPAHSGAAKQRIPGLKNRNNIIQKEVNHTSMPSISWIIDFYLHEITISENPYRPVLEVVESCQVRSGSRGDVKLLMAGELRSVE
ncbi:hypothetical protein Y032_0002g573 [Ancylostoma ceylanicum]|uniref:Uncharacterized protein n=1 Tax=Ancylostoma ceylanicum TaxID=53326 RepID=A0A016VZS2_9BILA|nr:hypothetical protein Y032_0002g573 [Ancylostoma ceylanicum]